MALELSTVLKLAIFSKLISIIVVAIHNVMIYFFVFTDDSKSRLPGVCKGFSKMFKLSTGENIAIVHLFNLAVINHLDTSPYPK